MKKTIFLLFLVVLTETQLFAQVNMTLSNPGALQVISGQYDPSAYTPLVVINSPDSILHGIVNRVSKDTMISYLKKIDSYYNRNSGSDTISSTRGIGAVRRWIFSKFNEYRAVNENRLVLSYLDFDRIFCGQTHHRDVLAILPGLDTTQKEIILLEAHFDTRCEGVCDTACYSPGMEDNGSGTILVMELARVMSRYAFDHTIMFACVTGEDQGLYGSAALANYLYSKNVKIRAVLNNDVIGGITCGQTSSPPGCPGLNAIDSTEVRIFSLSAGNDSAAVSPHKQLARYIRMNQEGKINPLLTTPMKLNLIITQDRVGRSGDHIPFTSKGYTAIRFCSQYESGDGTGTPPDRQHSVRDILGIDTSIPPDGIIDSFFVDPGYLRRNTIMNGVNLGLLAIAPPSPDPEFRQSAAGIEITLHEADSVYNHYRVGVRSKGSGSLYFDTLFSFSGTNKFVVPGLQPGKTWYFSVANMRNGVESLFSPEYSISDLGINEQVKKDWGLKLEQNHPNPFTKQTEIEIEASPNINYDNAKLTFRDSSGREIKVLDLKIHPGINKVTFSNPGHLKGVFTYSLSIGGKVIITRKMIIQ